MRGNVGQHAVFICNFLIPASFASPRILSLALSYFHADVLKMTAYSEATDLPPPQIADAERDSADGLDEDEIKLVIT